MGKFRWGMDIAHHIIKKSSFPIRFQSTAACTCSATGDVSGLIKTE